MNLEFVMDHQFVNRQTLPFLRLDSSHFILTAKDIVFKINSDSVGIKVENQLLQMVKGPMVLGFQIVLNTQFNNIFNKVSGDI